MTNLTESPIYEEGIFQLEKSTPPLGGAPVIDNGVPSAGHANAQALQLANRTAWLKEQVDHVGGGGQYQWSDAYVAKNGGYSKGSVLQSNDGLNSYVSLIDNNSVDFNVTPASIGVSWELYSGSELAEAKGAIGTLRSRVAGERLQFRKLHGTIPMRSPDYVATLPLLTPAATQLYPQGITLDEVAGEALVIMYGNTSNQLSAIYVLDWPSLDYKKTVLVSTQNATSESLVVTYESGSRKLYCRSGNNLARFAFPESADNLSTLVKEAEVVFGVAQSFAFDGYRWYVEMNNGVQGSATVAYRSRYMYKVFDSSFALVGTLLLPRRLCGGDDTVGQPKHQGFCCYNGGFALAHGGAWLAGQDVTPYKYQGISLITNLGEQIKTNLMRPDLLYANYVAKGFAYDRVEMEGVFSAGRKLYSLSVHANSSHANAQMAIFEEGSAEDDAEDFESMVVAGIGTDSFDGGVWPVWVAADGTGKYLPNPFEGTVLGSLEALMDCMLLYQVPVSELYTSNLTGFTMSGAVLAGGIHIKVTRINVQTFRVDLWTLSVGVSRSYAATTNGTAYTYSAAYYSDGVNTLSSSGVSVSRASGAPTSALDGAAGNHRQHLFQTAGSTRWRISADSVAEAGSNSGSNLAFARYGDNGVIIATPFQINRASGETQLSQLAVSGPVKVGQYTLATLPSAPANTNALILVTDSTGGPKWCTSNASVWQILNTTTTVS